MRPTEATSAAAAFAGEQQRISLPLANGAGGGFGALMTQVRSEITDFIDCGSVKGADATLGAQAQTYLARIKSATGGGAAAAAGSPAETLATRQAFLAQIAPWAEATGSALGVSPEIIAAHAALESGWGQHPIRRADGSDSHNLFGIKAGGSWQGDSASVTTTEFENGAALKKTERFRSYADPGAAFDDFARLLQGRYPSSLKSGNDARAYAQGLARGGYATDPAYADKLTRIAASLQSGE